MSRRMPPVADIVKQLVNMIVEPLLPLYGAPNFNTIADKPLYDKGRFVISTAETVKHIDKQNVKAPGNWLPAAIPAWRHALLQIF